MRNIISFILLFLPLCAIAQSQDQNYIQVLTYKDSTITSNASKANAAITYFDGLGRPIQQIAGRASGNGKDVVTHIEYDQYGRQPKSYLPYASTTTSLNFVADAKTPTHTFYAADDYENTANPYSEKVFEASPFNRVLKQAAPGNAWSVTSGHTINFAYALNGANEVKKFTATSTLNTLDGLYNTSLASSGNYPAGQLYRTITTDENGVATVEYKNVKGQLVCKVISSSSDDMLTHYVYDQYDNLSFVIPPAAENEFSEQLCYSYRYDRYNRLAEKKLPGKTEVEYIIYDALDRVVATGPAYSPFGDQAKGWMYTYYDIFNRVCITGWFPGSFDTSEVKKMRTDHETVTSIGSGSITIDDVPTTYNVPGLPGGFKVLTINYYDNYTWPGAPTAPTSSTTVEGQKIAVNVKGLLTGTWDRVLNDPSATGAQVSYTFYDRKYRPVKVYTTNYMGGYTTTETNLDFDGTPQYSITKHKRIAADTELVTRGDYTYTTEDRLLTATHLIGTNPAELMSHNTYNELGQLISKNVGGADTSGSTGLQKVDYGYTIRGWLKSINNVNDLNPGSNENDLFAFKLNYDGPLDETAGNTNPLYNGNISETTWRTSTDNIKRRYVYSYDILNRLKDAWYIKPDNVAQVVNSYDEHLTYDKNGNILTLKRKGEVDNDITTIQIDDLEYVYDDLDKNKLLKVIDHEANSSGFKDSEANEVDDYVYDEFGNMISDRNKEITSIAYNHLNLPTEIRFKEGEAGVIVYLYTASGIKIKKEVHQRVPDGMRLTVTDYLQGYQYMDGKLQLFPTAEGYVDITEASETSHYNYVYQYKDHLGNVRVNYTFDTKDMILKIISENHYYPFGLQHKGYNNSELQFREDGGVVSLLERLTPENELANGLDKMPNNYKYNGKEWQDELGLNMYAMDWRQYDPAIARWVVTDPVTHYDFSPYNGFDNNPVFWSDPSGMDAQVTGHGVTFTGSDAQSFFSAYLNMRKTGSGSFKISGDFTYASGPGMAFLTMDDAAIDFAMQYNSISIIENIELGSLMYSMSGGYAYTVPTGHAVVERGTDSMGRRIFNRVSDSWSPNINLDFLPDGAVITGYIHTHAWDRAGRSATKNQKKDNIFSPDDLKVTMGEGTAVWGEGWSTTRIAAYVVTPNGSLRVQDAQGPAGARKDFSITNTQIPSDPLSPTRKNFVYPNIIPTIMPKIYDESQGQDPTTFKYKKFNKDPHYQHVRY